MADRHEPRDAPATIAPAGPIGRVVGAVRRSVDALGTLADRTPPDRDRVVDAVRAASIVMVVVWHWSLSLNHRNPDGELVNPNPIEHVTAGWLPTWLLQVMPLFFVVGGFANRRGWCSAVERGDAARAFLAGRARRLLAPVAAYVAVWVGIELIAWWVRDDHRPVLETAPIVFMPLWFVAAYLWVVVLTPLTSTWHDRYPATTLTVLAVAVAGVDALRFGLGLDGARWVNLVLVWIPIHQLGYLWADGTATAWSPGRRMALAGAGLAGLVLLTSLPAYPRSMVATTETDVSHMYPPTAVLAVLAVTQLGVVLAVHPWLSAGLARRGVWMAAVAVNTVIMTIFLWHTTALLGAILAFEALGGTLGAEPTVSWWSTRPLWLLGPALVLIPLVALFSWIETGRR